MKKQFFIFVGIFLFLAIGMHITEWFSHPVEHLLALPSAGAYGLGMLHPLIFTLLAYFIFILVSFISRMIQKTFSK